jgi:hypothetical protein
VTTALHLRTLSQLGLLTLGSRCFVEAFCYVLKNLGPGIQFRYKKTIKKKVTDYLTSSERGAVPPRFGELPMRTLALLFLGVVVGWAASGVDWSRDAVGQEAESRFAELREVPSAPIIGPMIEISSSRDVRKVIVPDDADGSPVDRYKAITRVQIEELGGRKNADGIVGTHDLKFLTAGLNTLAAEGWSLVAIEQAHRYSISGPGNASITNPATYILERR